MSTGNFTNWMTDQLDKFKNYVFNIATNPNELMKRFKSTSNNIAREAKKSIMHYPLFISDTCNIEMGTTLAKSLEFKNAVLTKIVIERIGIIKLGEGEGKDDIIRKVTGFDALREEYTQFDTSEFDGTGDGLNTQILGTKVIQEGAKEQQFIEKYIRDYMRANKTNTEIDALNSLKAQYDPSKGTVANNKKYRTLSDEIDKRRNALIELQNDGEENRAINKSKAEILKKELDAAFQDKRDLEKHEIALRNPIGKSWGEVKTKINGAEPLKLEVTVEVATDSFIKESKFTLGIKSLIHVIPTEEIIKFLPKAKFDMSILIKLARLYSGEIKFWRDFVFNMREIKSYYKKDQSGKDAWYAKLKRLTSDNSLKRMAGNDIMPTVTLAISAEEADEMYRITNGKFDIYDNGTAKSLVNSLSLLNFVIIDEANERIWWFDESDGKYDLKTLDTIKKEDRQVSQSDLLKTVLTIANK